MNSPNPGSGAVIGLLLLWPSHPRRHRSTGRLRHDGRMTDPISLWNFDDPAGSEQRLREAADVAEGRTRLVLLTQVARALGLQGRYDEGHTVLDQLAVPDGEVAARVSLERGRLLRSSGRPEDSRPHF